MGKYCNVMPNIKKLKNNGLSYSDLYKLLSMVDKNNLMAKGGKSIMDIIDESSLSNEAKLYFKNSINGCEQNNYGVNKSQLNLKFENKFFNELVKYI